MAPVGGPTSERRAEVRVAACGRRWRPDAVLRPGQPVVVVNINSRAALVESDARLRPGAQTELHLSGRGERTAIKGHLDRCHVSALEPLRYRGLVVFDHLMPLEVAGGESVGTECTRE